MDTKEHNLTNMLGSNRAQYSGSIFKFHLHRAYSLPFYVFRNFQKKILKKNDFWPGGVQKTKKSGFWPKISVRNAMVY